MKRRDFDVSSALGTLGAGASRLGLGGVNATLASSLLTPRPPAATRKILIAGGGFGTAFIRYMAQLTGKPRPRVCYLPTASADSQQGTLTFFQNCAPLNVEPHVQNSFIASTRQSTSWEEVFL